MLSGLHCEALSDYLCCSATASGRKRIINEKHTCEKTPGRCKQTNLLSALSLITIPICVQNLEEFTWRFALIMIIDITIRETRLCSLVSLTVQTFKLLVHGNFI